jgi:ribosomal protein S18 acetylase RimI-like enzyme
VSRSQFSIRKIWPVTSVPAKIAEWKNSRNDLIGGLVGSSLCGWVYVNTVWVADEYRHRGIGKKLMSLAEEGRRRGCHDARLEISEAQAPGFYFKLGYSVFGVLDDYPKGLSGTSFKRLSKV